MKVWRHTLDQAPPEGACILTLGTFDGVHAGHRRVLELAAQRARDLGLPAVVVTFDPHPAMIVAPERRPKLLMTLAQRLAAFAGAGMDLAWIIPFSRAFSELSPEAFLAGLLHVSFIAFYLLVWDINVRGGGGGGEQGMLGSAGLDHSERA